MRNYCFSAMQFSQLFFQIRTCRSKDGSFVGGGGFMVRSRQPLRSRTTSTSRPGLNPVPGSRTHELSADRGKRSTSYSEGVAKR